MLKILTLIILQLKNFKESSDLGPINEFSHKLTDKYFDNVDLLTCIVSTALVIFIIIQIKKCLKFRQSKYINKNLRKGTNNQT